MLQNIWEAYNNTKRGSFPYCLLLTKVFRHFDIPLPDSQSDPKAVKTIPLAHGFITQATYAGILTFTEENGTKVIKSFDGRSTSRIPAWIASVPVEVPTPAGQTSTTGAGPSSAMPPASEYPSASVIETGPVRSPDFRSRQARDRMARRRTSSTSDPALQAQIQTSIDLSRELLRRMTSLETMVQQQGEMIRALSVLLPPGSHFPETSIPGSPPAARPSSPTRVSDDEVEIITSIPPPVSTVSVPTSISEIDIGGLIITSAAPTTPAFTFPIPEPLALIPVSIPSQASETALLLPPDTSTTDSIVVTTSPIPDDAPQQPPPPSSTA